MPRPYSLDLREHVVPAVAYGLGCRVARGVYSGHHDGGALVATVASDRECRGVPMGRRPYSLAGGIMRQTIAAPSEKHPRYSAALRSAPPAASRQTGRPAASTAQSSSSFGFERDPSAALAAAVPKMSTGVASGNTSSGSSTPPRRAPRTTAAAIAPE